MHTIHNANECMENAIHITRFLQESSFLSEGKGFGSLSDLGNTLKVEVVYVVCFWWLCVLTHFLIRPCY